MCSALVARRSDLLLGTDEKVLQRPGEFEQAWPQFLKQLPQTPQGRRDGLLTCGIREAAQRPAQLPEASPRPGEGGNNAFDATNEPRG